jgi:hypothetical protein
MPKLGLDEQKPDTRPATPGNAAMDADARYSPGGVDGRSGEARGKDSMLNLGDLPLCAGTSIDDGRRRYRRGNMSRWSLEKSAEAVVVRLFGDVPSLAGNTRRGGPTMPRKSE